MADLSKTIEILFAGVDNVSDVVNSISSKLDSAGENAQKFGSGLQDFAAPFDSALKAVGLLDAAILGLAASALKISGDIEAEANKMANALGLPTEKAEEFKAVAEDVYKAGFGNDLAEAFGAVTLAQQKFTDESASGIEEISQKAMALSKTFGVDYADSLSAVKTLTTNFGISSSDAFDLISAGFQSGLDGSGDFIESINEYSTQFSNGGASASQMFSIFKTGFSEGILGTDKAADAFKEFNVRILDGSKTTQESLDMLGLGQPFLDSLSSGKISAIDAFQTIITKLGDVEDKSVLMQAGVGLIGTQFEDLGAEAVLALSTTATKLGDVQGTLDKINTATFEQSLTSAFRTVSVTIGEIDIFSGIKDRIGYDATAIAQNFDAVLSGYDFGELEQSFYDLWDRISWYFTDAGFDLTSLDGMQNAVELVVESINSMIDVTGGIVDVFAPVVQSVIAVVEWFNYLDDGTKTLAGEIIALGSALGTVGGIVSTGGVLISGLSSLAGIVAPAGVIVAGFAAIAGGALAAADAIGSFASDTINSDLDAQTESLNKQNKVIEDTLNKLNELPLDAQTVEIDVAIEKGDYDTASKLIDEELKKQRELEVKAKMEMDEYTDAYNKIVSLGDMSGKEIEIVAKAKGIDDMNAAFEEITKSRSIEIEAKAKTEAATETLEYFINGKQYFIEVPVNTDKISEATKKIEDIPTEKQLEIKLQGDIDTEIAQIEASAKTAEAAFKYTAEVNTAQIESAARVAEAAFSSVGESVSSVSASVSDMFGSLVSGLSSGLSYVEEVHLRDMVEEQQDKQNELIDSQIKLNEAQIKIMELKAEALEKGESLISIDSSGLEPSLEMIMWEIIQKVQVKANEEAADFLLGIGA